MRQDMALALAIGLTALAATAAAGAPKPEAAPVAAPDAGDLYARIAEAYMKGNWDELDAALRAPPRELSRLTPAQRADITYVRQAMAECRPAWWQPCKAGRAGPLQPLVWGRALNVAYDPAGKGGMQIKNTPRGPDMTISWPAAEMDSPTHAEHGFSKGDLLGVGIWFNLGTGAAWAAIPPQTMAGLSGSEKDKLRLNLYFDFRADVTALYYTTPPSRRWCLWLCLAAYMEKYAKGPLSGSRRAAGAMFLVEVLKSPSKYPSVKLPDTLPAESAEETLAIDLKNKDTRDGCWTIAEDKAFREAVRAFAAANDRTVLDTSRVTLPNALPFAVQAEDDAPLRPKRDAWVKAQFDKAVAQ